MGAEQPAWRDLMLENGCEHLGMSYWAMRRRATTDKARNRSLDDRFPDDHELLLESGGYQANADPSRMSRADWEAYGEEYARYALDNQDRCTLITEFDCLLLGNEWIEEQRARIWSQLEPGRFLPVWHPQQGTAALDRLGDRYPRVAVVENVLTQPGSSAAPQLRRLMMRKDRPVLTHGSALTKPETIERIPLDTVASSSWVSATRFGDTIVWDGRRLHRYPARLKDVARGGRHRAWIEQNGFDADAIAREVNSEVNRFTIWSWLEWARSVPSRRISSNWETVTADGAPNEGEPRRVGGNTTDGDAGTSGEVVRAEPRERVTLPVIGFVKRSIPTTDGGTAEETHMVTPERSVRVCDTCLIQNCEMRKAGSECAFEFPVEMRTRSQAQAVRKGVLEMMLQRIGFMRYNEERSGGYADENLDRMIDRFFKAAQIDSEIEDERDFVKLSLEGRGAAPGGLLSKLFGTDVGERASRLPRPVGPEGTDRVIEGALSQLPGTSPGT